MTVETFQPTANGVAVAAPVGQGVIRIVEWAQSAEAARSLAEVICRTAFCPEAFRGKPLEATAAILAGGEVDLSPMASLNAFDIIQGRAAARAITLRAVVQSKGHEVELVDSTGSRCVMRGRRRGSEAWQQVTWTIDRAKQLKLTGKPNWQNQPQAMLLARATSELCRLIAADAIMGIGYTVEELDEDDAAAPARRTAQRRTQPASAPTPLPTVAVQPEAAAQPQGPPLPGEEASEPEPPAEPVATWTQAQQRKIMATFADLGITDREDRLAYCGAVIGHEIASTGELTVAEAGQVIESQAADADSRERKAGES